MAGSKVEILMTLYLTVGKRICLGFTAVLTLLVIVWVLAYTGVDGIVYDASQALAEQPSGPRQADGHVHRADQTDRISTALTTARKMKRNITFAGLISVALGGGLAFIIARGITRALEGVIIGLNEGAWQVNDAAGQVSAASQILAQGASEQASSLQEASSALEAMAAMARQNADNAEKCSALMGQANQVISQADATMKETSRAMKEISDASDQIGRIIKVIEEIAFQTNLLALNAAVEAARAGEHGKGFAVVADEVRNLAQRTAEAARETAGLIEETVERVERGVVLNETTNADFGKVGQATAKVSDLVTRITLASSEQAQGVEHINVAVARMDKVTQQNAAGAQESASAAEMLSAQAESVRRMVTELVRLVDGEGPTRGSHRWPTGPWTRAQPKQTAAGNRRSNVGRPDEASQRRPATPNYHSGWRDLTGPAADADLSEF